MTLVSCEHSVDYEEVKISEGGVINRSGLRSTRTIGHVTPRIVFRSCTLIISDFDPKFLFIEIIMGGPKTIREEP